MTEGYCIYIARMEIRKQVVVILLPVSGSGRVVPSSQMAICMHVKRGDSAKQLGNRTRVAVFLFLFIKHICCIQRNINITHCFFNYKFHTSTPKRSKVSLLILISFFLIQHVYSYQSFY